MNSCASLAVIFAIAAPSADYDWWSLRPLEPVTPPQKQSAWARNPIDQFIETSLRSKGLAPSPRADARTLVRRLTVDITGLPPTPKMVERFAKSPSSNAWAQLVDRLLASRHYGERWARHWLDVARYGESDGFEYNRPREDFWHYRDWVIRSLNEDLPYDQFAQMQIAGDAIKPGTLEGHAAVGFLVCGTHNAVVGGEPLMKQGIREDELEGVVGAISQTFLGLTANCARCHDHKTDPITTDEYYRFSGTVAGVNHGSKELSTEDGNVTPVYTVISSYPGAVRIYHRGDVASPGREVKPSGLRAVRNVPREFKLDACASDQERRLKLAEWITDPRNAIFLRVIVNRVWHYHFGVGLVETPNDLGFQGGRPSHPELLDWLALWLRDKGYSLKRLHRLIVTSATYQQSSQTNAAGTRVDTGNRLLWRQNPRRVEAEVLRDSVLDIAGQLNRKPFGPSYRDVEMTAVHPANYYLPIDPIGENFNRRTIYRWSVRGQRSALLDSFDCPDPSSKAPRRSVTTTPSQALSQWNHPFILRMSERLAQRVRSEVLDKSTTGSSSTESDRIPQLVDRAWRLVLARPPDTDEATHSRRLVEDHDLSLLCRVLFNSNEFVLID